MTVLIVLIVIAALFQDTPAKRLVATFLAALIVIHEVFFSDLSGFTYYLSAAILDLVFIAVVCRGKSVPLLGLILANLSLMSIGINFIGWACFIAYLEPTVYNGATNLLYFLTFLTLLWCRKARRDRGCCRLGTYLINFGVYFDKS